MSDATENQDQIDYWNGPAGERWAALQEALDPVIKPFGDAALDRARAQAGEHVVDVGCGCGATSLALADAVGPTGDVLGLDVSGPMLGRAAARLGARANVRFRQADAAHEPLARERHLLFSRFGIMFFRDPARAFANLRRALLPGGRAVFLCWQSFADNAWARLPLEAAAPVLGTPPRPPPGEPGPFSLADADRTRGLLEGAGFSSVTITPFVHAYSLGDDAGSAADFTLRIGPTARLAAEVDDATRARARELVRAALEPFASSAGVILPGATWIVEARAAE